MPVTADRVLETSSTIGTGTITLGGTTTGFRSFNSAFGVSATQTIWYTIDNVASNEWEVGIGKLTASNTLTRETILSSSNSGAPVSFSAGTKNVFANLPANEINRSVVLNPTTVYINPNGNNATAVVGDPTKPFATISAAITGRGSALRFELSEGTHVQGSGYVVPPAGSEWVGAGMWSTTISFDGTQDLGSTPQDGACCIQPPIGAGAMIHFQDLAISNVYAGVNCGPIGVNTIFNSQSTYPDIRLDRVRINTATDVLYANLANINIYAYNCHFTSNWDIAYICQGGKVYLVDCELFWSPNRNSTGALCDSWGVTTGTGIISILGGSITYNTVGNNTATTNAAWRALDVASASNGRIFLGNGFKRINTAAADNIVPFGCTTSSGSITIVSPVSIDLSNFNGKHATKNSPFKVMHSGGSTWMHFRIESSVSNRPPHWTADAAALTQTWGLVNLPVNQCIENVQVHVLQATTEPTTSTISVGLSGNPTKYINAANLKTTGFTVASPNTVEAISTTLTPWSSGSGNNIIQAVITNTGTNISASTGLIVVVSIKIGGSYTIT